MHGPVGPAGHAVLARAVERVDDPDPVCGQPRGGVLRLLREHRVARAVLGQLREQQLVGLRVAELAELLAGLTRRPLQVEQQLPGPVGEIRREPRVSDHWFSTRSMTSAASAATSPSDGRSSRSGRNGASYGAEMPVKSAISPARAFAYSPFGSRCSATSSGVSTKISMERQPGLLVDRAGRVAVLAVRRDQRHERDHARVGQQLGDLGGAADVLLAVLGAEAEVVVEPVPQVVAVEDVRGAAGRDQAPLDLDRDAGLARAGQAGEPERHALAAALLAGDRAAVPDDVGRLRAGAEDHAGGDGVVASPRRSG